MVYILYDVLYISLGKRDISKLEVKCDHSAKRRCTWVGTVATIKDHVTTCEFGLVPCPKECKDIKNMVKLFARKYLDKHLKDDCPNRDYSCQHCGEKGTYTSITKIHDKVCPKKPVRCPKRCSTTMPRQHISEHLATECEHTVIACKYKRLGCDREIKRKDMAAHEEDNKLHLRMAMDTTVKLENKTVKLENKTVKLKNKAVELERKTVELQKETVELERKTVELLKSMMVESNSKVVELQKEVAELRSKTVQDTLTILKHDESLKFKLMNYQKRKENDQRVQSPSYYTSPNGYHMALQVFANGQGVNKGTHLSVFAPVFKGKYDAQLKWPLIGKVTFTLLNQLEDKNHYQNSVILTDEQDAQVGGAAWGRLQFIALSALDYNQANNTQYLKDDTLYFRMSVEPADNKPWLS